MKEILWKALLVTAGVMAVRILLEEMGVPLAVTNLLGVAWLQILIPVYFGIRGPLTEKPYRSLLLAVLAYTVLARLMVVGTYSLAYLFGWGAFRFSVEGGGVVGEGVTALDGLFLIALLNQRFWIISGLLVGTLVGSGALFFSRRMARS